MQSVETKHMVPALDRKEISEVNKHHPVSRSHETMGVAAYTRSPVSDREGKHSSRLADEWATYE